jgi:replicative DNA helicase
MSKLHNSKLFIDEAAGAKAGGMLATARQIKRQHGLDLVVIDYLQLMTGSGTNRAEQVGEISRQLKLMAKTLQCPVICLSQLSRKVEERADKRPLMSDLRESGSIEQDADAILMLYRDDYYNPESPWRGYAELGLVKNRMGETGTVHLRFQPQHSRFRSADPHEVARLTSESQPQPKPFKRACNAI